MVNRVTVTLEQAEYSGLLKMAVEELRNPSHQLHVILRQELERRGLWSPGEEDPQAGEDTTQNGVVTDGK
jgi:hypothetical protein